MLRFKFESTIRLLWNHEHQTCINNIAQKSISYEMSVTDFELISSDFIVWTIMNESEIVSETKIPDLSIFVCNEWNLNSI